MNYNNWPWGEQNCTYIAGSWTYDMENLDIKPSLGSSPQSMRDSPLDFTHLLDESGVSYTKQHRKLIFFIIIKMGLKVWIL